MNNSRRSFIKNSSATLAGLGLMEIFPSDIYAKMRNKVGANDKINIGLIGLVCLHYFLFFQYLPKMLQG